MIVATGIVRAIGLYFVVGHWLFFVAELSPAPPLLLCHDNGCDRPKDGDKGPEPRIKT
jgi:hypothetical protein